MWGFVRLNIRSILLVIILFISFPVSLKSQDYKKISDVVMSINKIDSLNERLVILQHRLPKSKHDRAKYFRIKDEIVLQQFFIKYEEHYLNEDLEAADLLVCQKLSEARSSSRNDLEIIFSAYKKDINEKRKLQKQKYKELIESKKNTQRQFTPYFKMNTKESLLQAKYISTKAIEFAESMNMYTAINYIQPYKNKSEALIYDNTCGYDLDILTNKLKEFEKIFLPLIESKKLNNFNTADTLVKDCKYYSFRMNSKLPYSYFERQENIMNSKLLKLEKELALAGEEREDLVSRIEMPMDSVNQPGIYKFSDKIIVIGKYNPSKIENNGVLSTDERVNKGMAIIEADKMLTSFINKKVVKLNEKTKVVHTYFLPYLIDGEYELFFNLNKKGDKQFRVAYSFVGDKKLTETLLNEYLRPLSFKEVD